MLAKELATIKPTYSSGSVSAVIPGYPTTEEMDALLAWCKGWIPPKAVISEWRIGPQGDGAFYFNASWRASEQR